MAKGQADACELKHRDTDRDVTNLDDEQLGRAVRLMVDNGDGALVFSDEGKQWLRRV